MASMGGGQLDSAPLVNQIRAGRYVNKTLQEICAADSLPKGGNKAELQKRIIDRITEYSQENNVARFNKLREAILHPKLANSNHGSNYGASASSSPAASSNSHHVLNSTNLNGARMGGGNMNGPAFYPLGNPSKPEPLGGMPRTMSYSNTGIDFNPSPFYVIEEQLNEPMRCDVMAQHRHTVKISLASKQQTLLRVEKDPSLRVMVFCAAEGPGRQDILFPHQSEIKVNGGDVKANLRGLKNKPGSTRPVDITKDLRLNASYTNNYVEMTYALTNKACATPEKFFLILYIVKAIPVTDLVKKLESGKRITEEAVVNTMVNKARDADIVTTASVLSLKCPLSTLRIDLPCRSVACKHNQCFDATSYLQLQEQGPTWLCPICNNPAVFESLAVDDYVKNILKKTSRSIDQVTIQPDGKWDLHSKKEIQLKSSTNGASSDDEDLVEITNSGAKVMTSTPRLSGTPSGFLSQSGNGQGWSAPPSAAGSASNKRPREAAAVIDLTSSGDEDDEPLARPAPKRQQTSYSNYGNPSSIPAYRPPPPRPGL